MPLSLTGGWLTNLAFPDRGWWPLAYLGIALLLLALQGARPTAAAGIGLAWGLAFFLPHVRWAVEASGSVLPWLALSLLQAGYVACFGLLWAHVSSGALLRGRPLATAGAAAVLWVAVEQVRAAWPFGGFPWGGLAFSQTGSPLLRLAPFGGELLVSGTVALIGALIALAAQHLHRGRVPSAATAVAAAATLVVLPAVLPVYAGEESGSLRVGAVQGDVPEQGADWQSQARDVTRNHARGTDELIATTTSTATATATGTGTGAGTGAGQLDLVLWPESAADIDPRTDPAQAALVDGAARAAGAPLLLGTQRFPADEDLRYNEMVLWQAGQGAGATYAKQHPVPFGEYVPYRDLFRRLTPLVDKIGTDMAAGTAPAVLRVPVERLGREVPVVTGICFEVAYRGLVREGVLSGGELIVIPTNNASFGRSAESTQELAMSRFRAAEHGRATVQISTVGVSALIMPDGTVLERTELFTADQLTGTLPLRTTFTPAARLGETPMVLLFTLAAGLIVGSHVTGSTTTPRTVAATVPTLGRIRT